MVGPVAIEVHATTDSSGCLALDTKEEASSEVDSQVIGMATTKWHEHLKVTSYKGTQHRRLRGISPESWIHCWGP